MDIVERARSMILSPAATWPVVEQESTDFQKLYVPYLVVLATIPAVAGFIGMSVIGIGGFGLSMRVPLITGLGLMVSQYVMTLVMVFVWGWLISMLAATFGGQANLLNAVKLSVYASTPALLAGVFHAIPGTSVLAIVGALYSLYLVYLGLPVLMKNPAEKTIAYIQSVPAAALDGTEAKEITFPVGRDATRTMQSEAYLKHWMLPNLFFHTTTAYAILRHNGVELGKKDFLLGAAA